MIDRVAFVARWEARGAACDEPIDAFFCLWLALAVRARPQLNLQQLDRADSDRKAIVGLCERRVDDVAAALAGEREHLAWLAGRRGTRRADPIVDVHDYVIKAERLRTCFRKLAEHYGGTQAHKPGVVVEGVAELVNHVRNNLFHGIKDPDDVDDRELLRHLVPVLRAVLRGTA